MEENMSDCHIVLYFSFDVFGVVGGQHPTEGCYCHVIPYAVEIVYGFMAKSLFYLFGVGCCALTTPSIASFFDMVW